MTAIGSEAALRANSGCGCGGQCAGQARQISLPTASSFVRPRFFTGQLLCAEDLQANVGYVLDTARMRNRLMFGAGVVCGLAVACDPCDGPGVLVAPGYALDCSGHDLMVACAQRVDIVALAREARARVTGTDCDRTPGHAEQGSDLRSYGLYIRYEEELTDPLAPYPAGEPCGTAVCEASRVREGLRFLVRPMPDGCGHPRPRRSPLQRVLDCLGDTTGVAARVRRLRDYAEALAAAADRGIDISLTEDDRRRVSASVGALASRPDAPGRERLEHVRALAAGIVRSDHPEKEFPKELEVLRTAARRLTEEVAGHPLWEDRHRVLLAGALLTQSLATARETGTTTLSEPERRMLAQGLPLTQAVRRTLYADLDRVRVWLRAALETMASTTDCELLDRLLRIRFPEPESKADRSDTHAELGALAAAAVPLVDVWRRHVLACACRLLTPPCAPCEDEDVLLACVEVRDCVVVRVCAADRPLALPGAAWGDLLPLLPRLRAWADEVCCAPDTAPGHGIAPAFREGLFAGAPDDIGDDPVLSGLARALGSPAGGGARASVSELTDRVARLSALVDELDSRLQEERRLFEERVQALEKRPPARKTAKRAGGTGGGS
ncbi:hypothetical protein ACFW93_32195 [Streptomyces canus]|uniref:hypothetical protein n=1 Tax=Streptomyces canus TaxID=58343 RepID=UPI00367F850B